MTALPVPPPPIPALADHGGTRLKTPRSVLLVDTREQQPFDFSRFTTLVCRSRNREPFTWETTPVAGLEDICVVERNEPLRSSPLLHHRVATCSSIVSSSRGTDSIRMDCS